MTVYPMRNMTLTVIHGTPDPVLASFRAGKEYTIDDVSNRTKIRDTDFLRAELDRLYEEGAITRSQISTGYARVLVWRLP